MCFKYPHFHSNFLYFEGNITIFSVKNISLIKKCKDDNHVSIDPKYQKDLILIPLIFLTLGLGGEIVS